MKKFIEFCSSLPSVEKEVYRNINRKDKAKTSLKNYIEFNLLDLVHHQNLYDMFIRIYAKFILLKVYQKEQLQYSDLVFETNIMHWKLQKNMWNWYEIPLSKINEGNEDIVFKLINKSYEITHEEAQSQKDKKLYETISKLNFNEEDLFNMVIENKDAKQYVPLLESMKRKSVLLLENTKKRVLKGTTKFGGNPDLPLEFEWPLYENKPLTFLAQINLSEIENSNLPLPKTGILYFFIFSTNNDDDYYNYLNLLDDNKTTQIFYFDVSKENLKRKIKNNVAFNEVNLDIRVVNAYPETEEEPIFKNNTLSNETIETIIEIADIYYESIDYKLNIKRHHNLLGYYRPIQFFDYDAQEKNYITLFQMNSSDNLKMDWGDGGMLYIYIAEEDLKNLDFSKIIVDSQCS